jgi:uncharacterized protein (DUF362 family)
MHLTDGAPRAAVSTRDSASSVFISNIHEGRVGEAMEGLLRQLDWPSDPRSIGVKLNLCDYRKPETGAVSDPAIVATLLGGLRSRFQNADIFVYEHDANSTIASNLFGYVGIDTVAAPFDVRCVSLADEEWRTRRIRGLCFDSLEIPRLLEECDLLINHPKLKTHGRTLMTCALKNMFGCIRPKKKVAFHRHLAEAIADINGLIASHITVVDANLCLEGNRGPTQGLPKRLGLLFGGSDVVAVDAFAADLMGFGARHIKHVVTAAQAGLGTMNYRSFGDWDRAQAARTKFRFSMANFYMMQVARKLLT